MTNRTLFGFLKGGRRKRSSFCLQDFEGRTPSNASSSCPRRFHSLSFNPLALEYESARRRNQKELGLTENDITSFIGSACSLANRCKISFLWHSVPRDTNHETILEVTVGSKSTFIVPFNKRISFQQKYSSELSLDAQLECAIL